MYSSSSSSSKALISFNLSGSFRSHGLDTTVRGQLDWRDVELPEGVLFPLGNTISSSISDMCVRIEGIRGRSVDGGLGRESGRSK